MSDNSLGLDSKESSPLRESPQNMLPEESPGYDRPSSTNLGLQFTNSHDPEQMLSNQISDIPVDPMVSAPETGMPDMPFTRSVNAYGNDLRHDPIRDSMESSPLRESPQNVLPDETPGYDRPSSTNLGPQFTDSHDPEQMLSNQISDIPVDPMVSAPENGMPDMSFTRSVNAYGNDLRHDPIRDSMESSPLRESPQNVLPDETPGYDRPSSTNLGPQFTDNHDPEQMLSNQISDIPVDPMVSAPETGMPDMSFTRSVNAYGNDLRHDPIRDSMESSPLRESPQNVLPDETPGYDRPSSTNLGPQFTDSHDPEQMLSNQISDIPVDPMISAPETGMPDMPFTRSVTAYGKDLLHDPIREASDVSQTNRPMSATRTPLPQIPRRKGKIQRELKEEKKKVKLLPRQPNAYGAGIEVESRDTAKGFVSFLKGLTPAPDGLLTKEKRNQLFGKPEAEVMEAKVLYTEINFRMKEYLISAKQLLHMIDQDMQKSNCVVNWPTNEAGLIELVNKTTDDTDIDEAFWTQNISRIFAGTLQNYVSSANVSITEGFLEKVKEKIIKAGVNNNVEEGQVYFGPGSELCIVGSNDYVSATHVQALGIQAELDQNSKTIAILVPTSNRSVLTLLEANKFIERLKEEFKTVTFASTDSGLQLNGDRQAVELAEEKTKKMIESAITTEITGISETLDSMISRPKIMDCVNEKFSCAGIPTLMYYFKGKCYLVSLQQQESSNALHEFKKNITKEVTIEIDSVVAKLHQWITEINQHLSNSLERVSIHFNPKENTVFICGVADDVTDLESKIEETLLELEIKEYDFELSFALARVLEYDQSWKDFKDKYGDNCLDVVLMEDTQAIHIKSTRAVQEEILNELFDLENSLVIENIQINKLGIHKYFKTEEAYKQLQDISTLEKTFIEFVDSKTEYQEYETEIPESYLIEGGLKINIVRGHITEQKADVLVNLEGGKCPDEYISEMVKEYKQNLDRGLAFGSLVQTGGYGLPFKKVYHFVCSDLDDQNAQLIPEIIMENLKLAEISDRESIAFSGSAFMNRFPQLTVNEVSRKIIWALRDISMQRALLKMEVIVVVDNPALLEQLCSDCVNPMEPTTELLDPPEEGTETCAITFPNGSLFKLVDGSITTQRVDVLVNSVGGLNLNQGEISKEILKEAGPDLQREINQTGQTLNVGDMVVTSGQKLNAKSIFHVNPGTNHLKTIMEQLIDKCLQKATNLGYQSIAFPSIGTGGFGWSSDMVANATLETIKRFDDNGGNPLQTSVVFPDYGSERFQSYSRMMATYKGYRETGVPNSHDETKEREIASDSFESETTISTDSVSGDLTLEDIPLVFKVHGLKADSVKESISRLSKLAESQYEIRYLEEQAIDVMEDTILNGIVYTATVNEVRASIETSPSQRRIMLEGYHKDVDVVTKSIQEKCREVDKIQASKLADIIQVRWEYLKDDEFIHFGAQSVTIEREYKTKKPGTQIALDDGELVISFADMTATFKTIEPRKYSLFRRSLDLPDNWFPQEDKEVEFYDLETNSNEYKMVETDFVVGLHGIAATIIKIQRIQNPVLFRMYSALKSKKEMALPADVQVERKVWHGTSLETVNSISRNCFDRSYCGKNATACGQGVYFATNSRYSAQGTYSTEDSEGNKYMYYVRALVGRYTVGNHHMKFTPAIDPDNPSEKYDSLVDNMASPVMFVLFNDSQAYPDYLITFRT